MIKESKMMILMFHLDEKEFKDLGLWVRSPIHNSSEKVVRLYDVLKKRSYKTQKSIDTLTLMRLMEMLPKGAKWKDISPKHIADLKVICSKLTGQVQNFLTWRKMQEDNTLCNRRLMDALLEKQLFKLIPPIINKARKTQEASPIRDVNYCIGNYHLTEMDFYMDVFQKNREAYTSMKNTVDKLQEVCLSQLFRYYCAISNARDVVKIQDEFPLIALLKDYVKNNTSARTFTVETYYLLLEMLDNESPDNYYRFKDKLFASVSSFDTNEFRQLLGFMSNYCLRTFRQGNKEFIAERFEVFVMGLERGCWTAGIYFSPHQFVQIIYTALLVNKLEWADDFLSNYENHLPPDTKNNILNYCKALLAFQKGAYDIAQAYLIQIDNTQDFMYRIEFKILLIKIYYDKNELTFNDADDHPINNELEAIRNYALPGNNKKMSETVRQQYSNFANLFKRILNRKKKLIYSEPLTQANLEALQNDLTQLKPLIERTWLEEKIAELMQEIK